MDGYRDDPTILDDAALWRRIPPWGVVAHPNHGDFGDVVSNKDTLAIDLIFDLSDYFFSRRQIRKVNCK